MVLQLAYVSAASSSWSRGELLDLLGRSRVRNRALDVTGVLLHREGRFLQLLEGDARTVTGLYERIVADDRHHDVTTVLRRRRLGRQFADWTMAFRDLDARPIDAPGYRQVMVAAGAQDPATRELLARLRPARPPGRSHVHGSRVLGLVSAAPTG